MTQIKYYDVDTGILISVILKTMRLLLWKLIKTIYIFLSVTILRTEFATL